VAFDVAGARQAGYSDDEIAEHLAQSRSFNLDGARKAGYSPGEIINHLEPPGTFEGTGTAIGQGFGTLAGIATRVGGMALSTMARSAEVESHLQEETEMLRRGIDIGSGQHDPDDSLSQGIIGASDSLARRTEEYWKAPENARIGLGAKATAAVATVGGFPLTYALSPVQRAVEVLKAGGSQADAFKAAGTEQAFNAALMLVGGGATGALTKAGAGPVASVVGGATAGAAVNVGATELQPKAEAAVAPGIPQEAKLLEPGAQELMVAGLVGVGGALHAARGERAAAHEQMAGKAEQARQAKEGPEPSPVEEARSIFGETKPSEAETKAAKAETQARQAAAAAGVKEPIEAGEPPAPQPAKSARVTELERLRDAAPDEAVRGHIDDRIQETMTEEEQQRTGKGLRAMAIGAGNEQAKADLLAQAEKLYPLKQEATELGIETKDRSDEDLQHDVWRAEDHGHAARHGIEPADLVGLPEIVEASRADPDAFERAAIQHEHDDAGFRAAVAEILHGTGAELGERGAGAEPRPGGAAEEPAVRGQHPQAAYVEGGAHAIRGESSAGGGGPGERPEGRPAVPGPGAKRGTEAAAEAAKPVGMPPEHASDLRAMAEGSGWAEQGGNLLRSEGKEGEVTGRTKWVPAQEWFGRMRQDLGRLGLSRQADIKEAVEKAISGKKMGKNEQRTVDWMKDEAAKDRAWQDLQTKHEAEPPLLENPTPQSLKERAQAAEVAKTGQRPLLHEGIAPRGWASVEPGPEEARLTAEQAAPRMEAAVREVKAWLDRKGLTWTHENTRYSLDENLAHGGVARLGPDGKYEISLSPETLAAHPNWAVKVLLHEHAHVVDWSGNLYSRHPDMQVRGGEPVGRAAQELYELHKSNPLMAEHLAYPLGKEGMNDRTLQAELFAQAAVARHVEGLREVMEREAPTTTRLIDEAFDHAGREGKLPEGATFESEIGRIRSQFAATGRVGSEGLSEHGQPAPRLAELFGPSPGKEGKEKRSLAQRISAMPLTEKARAAAEPLIRDFQSKISPMTTGSERSMADAKEFANARREADYNYQRFAEMLARRFTPEQNARMWEAGEEENEIRGGRTEASPDRGLASLSKDQRDVMGFMHEHQARLVERARAPGIEMIHGEVPPYYVTRMARMVAEDGTVEPIDKLYGKGGLNTQAPFERKHFGLEESEAALKAKLGTSAEYIRDIRTVPIAMARLERAIAGRELVNKIHELSFDLAMDRNNFVPFDHPAVKSYRFNEETGKLDTVNRLVPKEFEGPLKAVLTEPAGAMYKALLAVKNSATTAIMWSPAIHLGVEFGRAAPVMRGKMATVSFWKDGLAMMRDPETMKRFLRAGYIQQGRRNLRTEDIGQTVREPELEPGRGLASKAAGAVTSAVAGREAGQALKAGIDRFGDFWHGTLLWDRVAQLQAGIAVSVERQMIKEGYHPEAATVVASHIANRYAGALAPESMSNLGRKVANLLMFSRSFTLGNLGAMKDVITGLPRDTQALLRRTVGDEEAMKAIGFARRKAQGGMIADIALLYGLNALVQTGISALRRSRDEDSDFATAIGKEGSAMIDRLHEAASRMIEHPVLSVLSPFESIESMLPQGLNEPDKTDRILVGHQADGTAEYMRLPFGKVGEEFKNWLTKPGTMLYNKLSTLAKPPVAMAIGDPRQGYTPDDTTARRLGLLAVNFMKAQVPSDAIAAAYRKLTGQGQELDTAKLVGPVFGATFSHGYPGGEEAGAVAGEQREHHAAFTQAAPQVREAIAAGDYDKAQRLMDEARMTPQEQKSIMRSAGRVGPSPTATKRFYQTATPEEIQKLEELQQR